MSLRANLSGQPHSSSQGNQLRSGMMRLHSVSLYPISIISAEQVARAPGSPSMHSIMLLITRRSSALNGRGVLCKYLVICAVGDLIHAVLLTAGRSADPAPI